MDRNDHRLALATELGATHLVDTSTGCDVAAELRAHGGGGYDVALDSTGVPDLIRAAVDSLGARGTCGFVAGAGQDVSLPLMSLLHRGRALRGIMGGDGPAHLLLPRLMALHERGRFPFDRLIRHYPFEQINAAMADATSGTTIKPVLTFG